MWLTLNNSTAVTAVGGVFVVPESQLESFDSSRFIQSDMRHSSKHTALMLRHVIHVNWGSVAAVLPTVDLFERVLPATPILFVRLRLEASRSFQVAGT